MKIEILYTNLPSGSDLQNLESREKLLISGSRGQRNVFAPRYRSSNNAVAILANNYEFKLENK